MSWSPDRSPYAVMHSGKWRPVTWLGYGSVETDDPTRATAVVLYLGGDETGDEWTAISVHPGEVVRNPEAGTEFINLDDNST